MSEISIAGRRVGPGQPVYVVAEASANHLGDLARAKALIEAAAEAGADAIKFQCYESSDMCLPDCQAEWHGTALWHLYEQASMPKWWLPDLMGYARKVGITLFVSVFNPADVRWLEALDMPAYKLASFEATDYDLIRTVAATGKPLILSTGMASQGEIMGAVIAAEMHGAGGIALLKCTSAYPAPASVANLATIPKLAKSYRRATIGLSDHTRSNAVVSAAVALGARIVERHLTLSRQDGGPDAAFSDEPAEFAAMVKAIRETEAALGAVHYGPTESERDSLRFRRSCWVVRDIQAGEALTPENVRVLRPADGLPPSEYDALLGRRAKVALARGTPLSWEMLE